MKPSDIARVQSYLRSLLGNEQIHIDPPPRRGAPVEVRLGKEFLGTLHRDEEEGEVSFSFHMTILEEDLPSPEPQPASRPARPRAKTR
ncbi:MAG: DUF3126 family protein [Acetobacteraceae bacterium]|nr:DUF3126 family protein [Acetobacteraceae bacterium]MBV8520861.1 DUF3126 family protein [Acetobacteraceae bacterium]